MFYYLAYGSVDMHNIDAKPFMNIYVILIAAWDLKWDTQAGITSSGIAEEQGTRFSRPYTTP